MDKQKDIFIKYKLSKYKEIPEEVDDLFNNFVSEMKNNKVKKDVEDINVTNYSKIFRFKKFMSIAACLMLLVGGNVYADTKGYGNIFFLVHHIVTGETITDRNELLSDKVITISYTPIKIKDGVNLQINTLEVKDNQAKLNISVEKESSKISDIKELTYIVYDDNNIELCNQKERFSNNLYSQEELVLNKFKNDTKMLYLNVFEENKKLMKININIDTKEINVEDIALQKISEVELRKYLSSFALLDYDIRDENVKKILTAISLNQNVLYNKISEEIADDGCAMYDATNINELIKSFTDITLNDNNLLELSENDIIEIAFLNEKYYYKVNKDEKIVGLCLNIDDISYSNGIYEIEYTYCFPTGDLSDNKNIEDFDNYTNTIKLILNEDSYIKYFIKN